MSAPLSPVGPGPIDLPSAAPKAAETGTGPDTFGLMLGTALGTMVSPPVSIERPIPGGSAGLSLDLSTGTEGESSSEGDAVAANPNGDQDTSGPASTGSSAEPSTRDPSVGGPTGTIAMPNAPLGTTLISRVFSRMEQPLRSRQGRSIEPGTGPDDASRTASGSPSNGDGQAAMAGAAAGALVQSIGTTASESESRASGHSGVESVDPPRLASDEDGSTEGTNPALAGMIALPDGWRLLHPIRPDTVPARPVEAKSAPDDQNPGLAPITDPPPPLGSLPIRVDDRPVLVPGTPPPSAGGAGRPAPLSVSAPRDGIEILPQGASEPDGAGEAVKNPLGGQVITTIQPIKPVRREVPRVEGDSADRSTDAGPVPPRRFDGAKILEAIQNGRDTAPNQRPGSAERRTKPEPETGLEAKELRAEASAPSQPAARGVESRMPIAPAAGTEPTPPKILPEPVAPIRNDGPAAGLGSTHGPSAAAEARTHVIQQMLRPRPDRVTLELGEGDDRAQIRVALRGSTVRATILPTDPTVSAQLESGLRDLERHLTERGIVDARVTVQPPKPPAEPAPIYAPHGGERRPEIPEVRTGADSRQPADRERDARDEPRRDEKQSRSNEQRSSARQGRPRQEKGRNR